MNVRSVVKMVTLLMNFGVIMTSGEKVMETSHDRLEED